MNKNRRVKAEGKRESSGLGDTRGQDIFHCGKGQHTTILNCKNGEFNGWSSVLVADRWSSGGVKLQAMKEMGN